MARFHVFEMHLRNVFVIVGHVLELILCLFVAVGLFISLKPLSGQLGALLTGESLDFHHFLESAFNLVIGIEFIDMLTKHSPGSAIEVLLYALVRHMVIEGGSTLNMLIGTLAILVIFVVRKFFFVKSFEEKYAGEDPPEEIRGAAGEGHS